MKNNIFINRYVMACAISIVIALVGYICMNTLPIEQYPDIAPPTVRISTTYTGADANTIMKSVVQPLEEAINGVPDMTYMTSSASSSGDVSIVVYFKAGTDPDLAAVNVQNRVTRATAMLPADVTKVGVQVFKMQSNILQIGALRSVAYVYVLTSRPDDTAHQQFERRAVAIGLSDGLSIELKSGVKAGELLRGNQK